MASSSSSVQFRDRDSVLTAFKNREVELWSIWQGKQFMFKGEGEAELSECLELLCNGGTNATYTLCIYEDLKLKSEIKSKSEHDGSFNFRLNEPNQAIRNEQYGTIGKTNEILARIEKKLDGDIDEKPNQLGIIGEILEHPSISPVVPAIIQGVLSKILGLGYQYAPRQLPGAAAIGNVETIPVNAIDQDEQIRKAIDRLKKQDAKLGDHLEKLATIAETDKPGFIFLMQTLDNLNT